MTTFHIHLPDHHGHYQGDEIQFLMGPGPLDNPAEYLIEVTNITFIVNKYLIILDVPSKTTWTGKRTEFTAYPVLDQLHLHRVRMGVYSTNRAYDHNMDPPSPPSIPLYYISLYLGWEIIHDQHRNPNIDNKDHLVGQLTTTTGSFKPLWPCQPN